MENKHDIPAQALLESLTVIIQPKNHVIYRKQLAAQRGVSVELIPESAGFSLGMIDLITAREYTNTRNNLNLAFEVGDYPKFNAPFNSEETEAGDICDVFGVVLRETFSKPFTLDQMLSYEVRLKWRNLLLEQLDEMVGI